MKYQVLRVQHVPRIDNETANIARYPRQISRLVVVEYKNRHCYSARSA